MDSKPECVGPPDRIKGSIKRSESAITGGKVAIKGAESLITGQGVRVLDHRRQGAAPGSSVAARMPPEAQSVRWHARSTE